MKEKFMSVPMMIVLFGMLLICVGVGLWSLSWGLIVTGLFCILNGGTMMMSPEDLKDEKPDEEVKDNA